MTPIRVAVGLMIEAAIFGWLVGKGASPAFFAILPLSAYGFISANRGLNR